LGWLALAGYLERSCERSASREHCSGDSSATNFEQLENQKDRYSRRWIWELFQNALDAAPQGQPTKIQIRHQSNKFTFTFLDTVFASGDQSIQDKEKLVLCRNL
jgi:hypothetical protein